MVVFFCHQWAACQVKVGKRYTLSSISDWLKWVILEQKLRYWEIIGAQLPLCEVRIGSVETMFFPFVFDSEQRNACFSRILVKNVKYWFRLSSGTSTYRTIKFCNVQCRKVKTFSIVMTGICIIWNSYPSSQSQSQ